jgi:hypothetical protein
MKIQAEDKLMNECENVEDAKHLIHHNCCGCLVPDGAGTWTLGRALAAQHDSEMVLIREVAEGRCSVVVKDGCHERSTRCLGCL